jgi:hypothetical protein
LALDSIRSATAGADYVITAAFRNTSQAAIRNPFFTATEMSAGILLKNADGGPGGVGATLSLDVGNGVLEPGESVLVLFTVALPTRSPFRFVVNAQGDPQQVP